MNEKTYDLRGRNYIQRPLVLAQLRALLPVLEKKHFEGNMGAMDVFRALGDQISEPLAIILIEEDVDMRTALNNLETRSKDIEERITPAQALEVIEDFFVFNRVSSVIERLRKTMANVAKGIKVPGISKPFSGDSRKETSPKGKGSSGA